VVSAAEKFVKAIWLWLLLLFDSVYSAKLAWQKETRPLAPKVIHKLLRLILWITIGALFIGKGCAACALLWKETDATNLLSKKQRNGPA
jgi:hypothetical protein